MIIYQWVHMSKANESVLYRLLTILFLVLACGQSGIVIATDNYFSKGIDSATTLPFWSWKTEVIQFRLVQRLPDQTRGYFMARQFPAEHAETIADSCVFQTIFKNTSSSASPVEVKYNLDEWYVSRLGKPVNLVTREKWHERWFKVKLPKAALIAFEWSLLPTRQTYNAMDYNWGMTMFDLKPGSRFELQFSWYENGKKQSATIPDLECAADIHPETDNFG